jgi:hypothetical protein
VAILIMNWKRFQPTTFEATDPVVHLVGNQKISILIEYQAVGVGKSLALVPTLWFTCHYIHVA